MQKITIAFFFFFFFLSFLPAFAQPITQPVQTPEQMWGQLFTQVQLHRVLGDNKTFVDAVPIDSPSIVLRKYFAQKDADSFDLKKFVLQNFILPAEISAKTKKPDSSIIHHLEKQWNELTRKADKRIAFSSLLPLPNAYIVPGGRFREIYYWDSYFTMLGLAVSNRYDLIENMLDNFAYLISTYGHIPNGNRSYYLSRSQPPFFALMVELLAKEKGSAVYKKYLPALEKEYHFWMEGSEKLSAGESHRRVVKMPGGEIVNRYYDDSSMPRQESYYEDVQTGLTYQNNDGKPYTNLRAAAESGWDFSSRWFDDTLHLQTIETIHLIPVDLNCLLYAYENILSDAYRCAGNTGKSKILFEKGRNRKKAILKYCGNDSLQYFFDYDLQEKNTTNKWTLSGMMPLFTGIATKQQAAYVKHHIEQKFLKPGGVVTTVYHTGQQWDAPNGWAPLQYITVQGLLNYGYDELAATIARRWLSLNEKVYYTTGKMLEKYNVEDVSLEGGGGEYPTQDGFGWTNGVYLKLHQIFSKRK